MLVGLSLSNYSDIFLARFVRLINMFRLFFLWWFCLFNQIYEFLSSYIYFSSWAGVPKLHSCTWCFSRTFRFNVVGIHETHYITFHCWWCFSSLWEDILSVIFHHTGGVICITKFKQASMKLKFTPERIFFLFSFFRCRKSEILNYCLWISRLSMMDFPLCYYPLRKLCSVSICMHPSLLFDFFSFCFK